MDHKQSPDHLEGPSPQLTQHEADSSPPASNPSDLAKENVPSASPEPYSVFTKKEKYTAVVLITFTAIFSPLSSFVFFPAINALSEALNVSVEKINLTVTSYMIVAGVAPAFVGDMADMTGRRNVYILTLFIYVVANVGLALQDTWIALFLLRMVQSAGGAGKFRTLFLDS